MKYDSVPGLVETRDAYGETTIVVDAERLVEACVHLRDELGFWFLSDVSATDYLGWGERGVAGYIGTAAGRDINAPGSQGYARLPEGKPKRFSVNYHLLALAPRSRSWGAAGGAGPEGTVSGNAAPESTVPPAASGDGGAGRDEEAADGVAIGSTAGAADSGAVAGQVREGASRLRVQVWLDDGEPVPSVVSVWPTADWHEREAYDLMGIPFTEHPNLTRILMEDDWVGHPLRKDYAIGGEPVRFSGEE